MEIYVMKKKFVLTLALVLMVAATLVAAPIELSGSFKAGYKWTKVGSADGTITAVYPGPYSGSTANQFGVIDSLGVSSDFWSVSFDTIAFDGDTTSASASLYLDKLAKEAGIDTGDFTLTLKNGNLGNMNGLNVYADPNGTVGWNSYKLRQSGSFSTGLLLSKGSMGSLYFTMDPTLSTFPVMVSASIAPMDGVSAAFGYTTVAQNKHAGTVEAKGGVDGSVCVDLQKLMDSEFGLKVSAMDVYYLSSETNHLSAAVIGSYEKVGVSAEYENFDDVQNVTAKVSYSGIENVGLWGKVKVADLTATTPAITVSGAANYTLSGVKFDAEAGYTISSKTLYVKPSVSWSF
jgi:hypothetical protein